jgi:hypothetical protein
MRRDSYRVDERTPFYLIGTLLLGTTILLSLVSMFHSPNGTDFFPEGGYYQGNYILDHTYIHKVGWYLSHFTYQFVLLLFIYFLLALFHKRSIPFFKTIAPASFALCIMYVYLLYPKQPLPSYQLPFSTIFSHFMTVFLVLCELLYIKEYTFIETTYCLLFVGTMIGTVYLNYFFRGVWSYDLIHLDTVSGWKLVSYSILLMYTFSLLIYLYKSKSKSNKK